MTAVAGQSWRSQSIDRQAHAARVKRLKRLADEAEVREMEATRSLQADLKAQFLEREARRRAVGG